MSNIKDFMIKKKDMKPKQLEVKFDKFPSPFIVQSITEAENKQLRSGANITKKNFKTGQTEKEFNQEKYMSDLVVACVAQPDLQDASLQEYFGTMGAGETVQVMLTSGEYATLLEAVQQVNGFSESGGTINELVDEVKNS